MLTECAQLRTPTLNFLVVGQIRSGASLLQTAMDTHPGIASLGELFHETQSIRRSVFQSYYGPQSDSAEPDWFEPTIISPEQFLTTRVFDHPMADEKAMGTKVTYAQIQQLDLWEYIQERCLSGDFCLIHVRRNPLACYVSRKQAVKTGIWYQDVNDMSQLERPMPVDVDIQELQDFCRLHAAHEAKLRLMCDDRLEIDYRELVFDLAGVMRESFSYLGLPDYPQARPSTRRLKNRSMRDRIVNFEDARRRSPRDIKPFFDATDLF